MQGFKEFLESLSKMTNVKLNISVLITCLLLVYFSTPEKFILDPVPKLIPQSLILITSIRIFFSFINLIHSLISSTVDRRGKKKEIENEIEEQRKNKIESREKIKNAISSLDVFQLFVINRLIGQNHFSIPKGAVLFSMKNSGVIFSVAIGEKTEGVSLTNVAQDILINDYQNDLSELERKALERIFNSFNDIQINTFKVFTAKEIVKTQYFGRDNRTHYNHEYDFFKGYTNSVIFKHTTELYTYELTDLSKDVLFKKLGVN